MSEKLAPVTAVTKRSPSYPLKLYLTEMVGRLGVRIACFVGRCTTTDKFFEAVVKMARKGEQEEDIPYMHLYATFAYMPQFDFLGGATCMIHSKPNAHPPEFKDFEAVKPAVDGGKIRNLTHLMAEIDPVGTLNLCITSFELRFSPRFLCILILSLSSCPFIAVSLLCHFCFELICTDCSSGPPPECG